MPETRFFLLQRTSNSCLYVLLFMGVILGILFGSVMLTSMLTDQLGASVIILLPAFLFGVGALEKRLLADTIATAKPDVLHLEVIKPGLHLKIADAGFPWALLQEYRFASGGRSGPLLQLRWDDGNTQFFVGGDVRPLFEYLKTHFPDRRRGGLLWNQ